MTIQSTLSLGEIKKRLQNHLKDDLAIIIGSGLSCAEGLPGMNDLAKHLSEVIPPHLSESDKILWDSIAPQLVTLGLEQALSGTFSYTLEKKF